MSALNESHGWVVSYPDGSFQGQPTRIKGRPANPKVTFDKARIYTSEGAARRSVAHRGGVAELVSIQLLRPSQCPE